MHHVDVNKTYSEKLDGNYTRILCAVLNKSWKQYGYIARYMDVWNRHRESEIHDIHEIGSGTKLYYLWVKGYSTWGERHTIFLCWLLLHHQLSTQPTRGVRSGQSRLASPSTESRLSRSEPGTQLTDFFSNPQNPQPTLPVHDIIHTPLSFPIWGFILTSVNDASSPRAREHLCSCLHLTNPFTEPKGSHPN